MAKRLNTTVGAVEGILPGWLWGKSPVSAFKMLSDMQIDNITKELSKKREKEKKDPSICCSNCGHKITSSGAVIPVAGQHRHTFKNPAGIYYSIGCFSSAQGCFNMGEPTMEYTWFPGYTWCYSVCSNCHTHMGWFFQSGDSAFYGLILNRLVEGK